MQHWITGVDRPALAGCDVVGGIEAGGPNVSNSPCLTPCSVYVILSAQGITVVLYKPQLIFIAEGFYRFKVEWTAQGVGQDHGPGPPAPGKLQLSGIQIAIRQLDIHKYRHRAALDNRGRRGWKARRHCDDLVPPPQPPLPQQRGGQRRHRQQISGGPGVYHGAEGHAQIIGQAAFKLLRVASGGQPKVQSGVHQIIQLLPIIDPARVVDSAARLIGGFFMVRRIILPHRLEDRFSIHAVSPPAL